MTDVEETEVTVEDEESEDEAPNAPSELDSSEDEFSEDVARLGISRQEVEANQLKMGEEVEDEKPSLNLLELREKYPEAFTQESETCLSAVLEDLQLPYKLTDYQVFAVNALISKLDVMLVLPTGSGKTLVIYLWAMAVRMKQGCHKHMMIVAEPLISIISGQLDNQLCPVATLTGGAELKGTTCSPVGEPCLSSGGQQITEDTLYSGRFAILFAGPEALASPLGQRSLRRLGRAGLLAGLVLDEVHQGLEGHWEKFRPGMVHLQRGAPLLMMTATITHEEMEDVIKLSGRRKRPVVLAEGPVRSHHKLHMVRRPSSQVPLQGHMDVKQNFVPGLLQLLRLLVLDRFVEAVKQGALFDQFKKTLIFFRDSNQMALVNSWLITTTGYQTFNDSPFAMNHATLSTSDEAMLQRRKNKILLYLTTNRMLLGVDLADILQIIIVRPPNLVHAILQAMGRAGRLLRSGMRRKALTYILFNAQDLGGNVVGMTDEIKEICRSTDTCVKKVLRQVFVGNYSWALVPGAVECCSSCARMAERM